jgi:GTPase Era involved in 16S rRNA processing
MNFEKYNERKENVLKILNNIYHDTEDTKLQSEIEKRRNQLSQDRFIISVFGHFSNGKSTFLNSLMGFGEEVLKEDEAASTATITRLKYPDKEQMVNKVELVYYDGKTEIIDRKELQKYTARNNEFEVEKNIKEVILFLESDFLKNGVEIVDTPGFNSTYELHTEIAMRQVESSDAAIFMFSYDMPGSSTEFNFLKHINDHMDKVIFVLNKIDLSEDTPNNNVPNTIDDILDKMVKMGVNVEGKAVYPLTARAAREAIAENSSDKLQKSLLPQFKDYLSNYLTSEENIKDRLDSPLKSLIYQMENKKSTIDDYIITCNKDNIEILKEQGERKARISAMEEDLLDKRKTIRNAVHEEIKIRKINVDDAVTKVVDGVKSDLDGMNSQFSVNLVRFDNVTLKTFADYMQKWDKISGDMESGLMNIVDISLDTETEYIKLEEQIRRVLRTSLKIEKIDVDNPKFDYEALKSIDDDILKAKTERDQISRQLESFYTQKGKRDDLLDQKKKKEIEITRLINNKEKEIERLSMIQVYHGKKMVSEERERSGFFGRIGNFLFGNKVVQVEHDIHDNSEKNQADKNIETIENMMTSDKKHYEQEILQIRNQIIDMGGVEQKIRGLESEEQLQNELYHQRTLHQQEEKLQLEAVIIKVEKDNYIKEVSNAIREYGRVTKKFLDDSKDKFISIINDILEAQAQKIQSEHDKLDNIMSIGHKTKEELDMEIQEMYKQKVLLANDIQILQKERSI